MDHPKTPTPFDDASYDLILKAFRTVRRLHRPGKGSQGTGTGCLLRTGRILCPACKRVRHRGIGPICTVLDTLRQKAEEFGLSPRLHQADMSDFDLPRRYALVMIPFNAVGHNMTQEAQVRCLSLCRQHLLPGGLLAFDTFFPSLAIIGTPQNTRVLEGEMPHPSTGLPMRMYDTRSFDRVAQVQHSINELELLGADGSVQQVHRSEMSLRYIYKNEMALLLRAAGFGRFEIYGDFDRVH